MRLGAQALMQCSGLGKLRPNIVVIGYKSDWQTDNIDKVEDYVNILHDAFEARLSVAMLRAPKRAKGLYYIFYLFYELKKNLLVYQYGVENRGKNKIFISYNLNK